ncbi:transposase [Nocardia sp. NPDC049707]|uniref:transposase n=1 Tax=Nocardia sp. NPDC049707 TaxID=3154735 RepID=UPI003425AFCF
MTEAGPVEIAVPRDRTGSLQPRIEWRLTEIEDKVISLSAKGMTTGDIRAHLREVHEAEVSKATISAITDRALEAMADWQSRPLD